MSRVTSEQATTAVNKFPNLVPPDAVDDAKTPLAAGESDTANPPDTGRKSVVPGVVPDHFSPHHVAQICTKGIVGEALNVIPQSLENVALRTDFSLYRIIRLQCPE